MRISDWSSDVCSSDLEVEAAGYAVSASTDRAKTIEGLQYQYLTRPAITRKGKYDFFFPSASLKYLPADDTEIHFGYSRKITRPEASDLAGVWRGNEEDIIVGTPNPKIGGVQFRTQVNNYTHV